MSKISSSILSNTNSITTKVRQITPFNKSDSKKAFRSPSPSRKPLSTMNKSPANSSSKVTLKDLCSEDKEKIGQLMNKLAVEKNQRQEVEKKAVQDRNQLEKKLKKIKNEKLKLLEESEKLKSQFEKSLDLLKTYKTKSMTEICLDRLSPLINTSRSTSKSETDYVGIPTRPEFQKDYYSIPIQPSIEPTLNYKPTLNCLNVDNLPFTQELSTNKKNSEEVQANLDVEITQSQFVKDCIRSTSLSETSYSNQDVQVQTNTQYIPQTQLEDNLQTNRNSSAQTTGEFKINELCLIHDFRTYTSDKKWPKSSQSPLAFTKTEPINRPLSISSTQTVTVALPEENSEIYMPSRDMSPTHPLDKSQRSRAIHEIKNLKNDIALLTKSLRHLNASVSPSVRSSQYKESVGTSKNVSPILSKEPAHNISSQWLKNNLKDTLLFQPNYMKPDYYKEEDSKFRTLLIRVAGNHTRHESVPNKSLTQISILATPQLIPAPFKFTSSLTFNPKTSVEESPEHFLFPYETPRVNCKRQEEELQVIDDCFYDDALFNLVDELEGLDLPTKPGSETQFNSKMISMIDDLEYQADLEYSPASNLHIKDEESDSSFEKLRKRNYKIRQSLGKARRL